jgi:hypothetical protein
MVMVTTSRDKRRRVPDSLHQFKPQNPTVESERPLKVSYLQMDMTHPHSSVDCRLVHIDSMPPASTPRYWPAKKIHITQHQWIPPATPRSMLSASIET